MAFWLCLRGAPPVELKPGKDVTIGRGQSCDVSLYSSLLSREHARVRWEGEKPVLFDLESLNGCFIGPDKIHRHELKPGDTIRMGDVQLQFKESEKPPAYVPESGLTPLPGYNLEHTPSDFEPASETRFFSRTAALHQKVFDYDELYWLLGFVEKLDLAEPVLSAPADKPLDAWLKEVGERTFWLFMRLGIVRPSTYKTELTGLSAAAVAKECLLTKRGERLKVCLTGGKTHWNEMASLRYKTRQGKIFKPLRSVARAYRPGTGLKGLTVPRMIEELSSIYAPDMEPDVLEAELRRLLCLGFLSPGKDAQGEAWWPRDWNDGTIRIAERGFAMLEGFRLED